MIDREKVKKGLDLCLTGEPSTCKDCPYDAECKEARGIGSSPLRRDALELLKEQEPVEHPELVRCKNCKNRGNTNLCPLAYIEETEQFTALCTDEWFCGNGKRR